MNIRLPQDRNRSFHISKLLEHLRSQGRESIVIGQQHVELLGHTKPNSLDYWIRENLAANHDVAQATNIVVDQLCASDIFARDTVRCIDTGNSCLGLILDESLLRLTSELSAVHFRKFNECLDSSGVVESWTGIDVVQWWGWVSGRLQRPAIDVDLSPEIFANPLTRAGIKAICNDSNISDATCAVAILAWGGQRRDHGVTTFQQFENIQPIIRRLRGGKISPVEAYRCFHSLWVRNRIVGLGAAYFTKLIFFCDPEHKGYIMDQWTSKSVNMIVSDRFIQLSASGHVTDKNSAELYNRFNSTVEKLGLLIGLTGEEVEMGMFSRGGHNPLCWREYVRENY